LIDIIIVFNSALQDEDFKTIDNRKEIAIDYIQGWFLLDVFAILPFTEILTAFGKREKGGS
jgi:hypothetical protein